MIEEMHPLSKLGLADVFPSLKSLPKVCVCLKPPEDELYRQRTNL